MAEVEMNVVTAPKDSVFQVRINRSIRDEAESIANSYGMTLTEVFNLMIQRMLNEKSIPLTLNSSRKMSEAEALEILIQKLDESRNSLKDGYCTAEEFRKRYGV